MTPFASMMRCAPGAIETRGLIAYRADHDASVEVPIDAIEEGIRGAAICLADTTTDNPNVWYKLGFAFATGRLRAANSKSRGHRSLE